jgi:hypothetical protein
MHEGPCVFTPSLRRIAQLISRKTQGWICRVTARSPGKNLNPTDQGWPRTIVLCLSQAELSNAPDLEKWGLTTKVEKQKPSGITFRTPDEGKPNHRENPQRISWR